MNQPEQLDKAMLDEIVSGIAERHDMTCQKVFNILYEYHIVYGGRRGAIRKAADNHLTPARTVKSIVAEAADYAR